MEMISEIQSTFSHAGRYLLIAIFYLGLLVGLSGMINSFRRHPIWQRQTGYILIAVNLVFIAGFIWICRLHYQIHIQLPLQLPDHLVQWLNQRLASINANNVYALPLYNPEHIPRFSIPVWIENEKYYFWFMCYALMALIIHFKAANHRLKALTHLLLAIQVTILYVAVDPFSSPLPQFFKEIAPWFETGLDPMSQMNQMGLFMRLYPKMIFYYNAHYMWLHPPLLFIAYACITLTFAACVIMLFYREASVEKTGYDFAKAGYILLTMGMLFGYPWALQSWGPNWWWDPKICSSIMMWAIFTTYLHSRLYIGRTAMWYFSSFLGILCFISMLLTVLSSYYFPGEHTFQ